MVWYEKIILILIGCASVSILLCGLMRRIGLDEYEGIHTAWYIAQGYRPYSDFFQHHHPLNYYLWSFIIHIIGSCGFVFLYARIMQLCLAGVIATGIYMVGRSLFNRITALVGTLLLLTTPLFADVVIDIRPDVLQTALQIISFFLLVQAFKTRRTVFFIFSGLSAGCAFICLQKAIVFVCAVGLCMLYQKHIKKISWIPIAWWLGCFFLPFVLYGGYLVLIGGFKAYWYWNVIYNRILIGSGQELKVLFVRYNNQAFMWTLCIIGGLLIKTRLQRYLILVVTVMLFALLCVGIYNPQYFLPIMPFVSLISAHGLINAFGKRKKELVLLLTIVTFFVFVRPWYTKWNFSLWNDMAYVDAMKKQIPFDEHVLCIEPCLVNVFVKDLHFYWFGGSLSHQAYQSFIGQKESVVLRMPYLVTTNEPMSISCYKLISGPPSLVTMLYKRKDDVV